jgi:hypothetical protein
LNHTLIAALLTAPARQLSPAKRAAQLKGHKTMNITITLEQYDKLRRLSDFADFYIDDCEPSNGDYANDREEITQAQEVIQDIDALIYFQEEQARRSDCTDAWIKQANQNIREGKA